MNTSTKKNIETIAAEAISFVEWKREADLPTRDEDGVWYDAETGFSFNQVKNSRIVSRTLEIEKQENNEKAKATRQVAKKVGCKALKGSAKQKSWGEDIRKNFLSFVTDVDAMSIITSSSVTEHAKFWIEVRNTSFSELESAMSNLVTATKKANEIGSGNEGYNEQLALRTQALKTLKIV